jgi:large subunit ribosomal protein L19
MKVKGCSAVDCKTKIDNQFLNPDRPIIKVGDTIKLGVSILEGNKERIQFSEGVVIAVKNSGLDKTITIRRVVQSIGVERIYLLHSPKLKSIQILMRSKVRRAKLYYLRLRVGKATRLQQKFDS